MVQFQEPPKQIRCPGCGVVVWSGARSAPSGCAGCGEALPRTSQIAFFTRANTEHRFANMFSEAEAWTLLNYLKNQFEHGHFSESLGITVDGTLIAPEDIDAIRVVSMRCKT